MCVKRQGQASQPVSQSASQKQILTCLSRWVHEALVGSAKAEATVLVLVVSWDCVPQRYLPVGQVEDCFSALIVITINADRGWGKGEMAEEGAVTSPSGQAPPSRAASPGQQLRPTAEPRRDARGTRTATDRAASEMVCLGSRTPPASRTDK